MEPKEYKTKQRELILACLRDNAGRHMSAAELTDELRQNENAVGQTTVYRTLERLVGEGIAHKYTAADGMSACYQYAERDECRGCYHLVCSSCGELIHISCEFLDELSEHIYADHRFRIDPFKTVLYGICEKCAANETSNSAPRSHDICGGCCERDKRNGR
ncbi:MAG: transcriptional repressor [Eubacteriales bacterium]